MKTPPPDLVAEAFLKMQPQTDYEYGISTNLPALQVLDQKKAAKDNWSGKNIWITPVSFGSSFWSPLPRRTSVVTLVIWVKPTDRRRFWGTATSVAQDIYNLGTDWYSNVILTMPYPGYSNVKLTGFTPQGDPRRIEGDPQGLARVEIDVMLSYGIL